MLMSAVKVSPTGFSRRAGEARGGGDDINDHHRHRGNRVFSPDTLTSRTTSHQSDCAFKAAPLTPTPHTDTHTQCSGWGLGMTGCSRNAVVSVWLLADLSVSLRCVWQRLTCRVTDWTEPGKWKTEERFLFHLWTNLIFEIFAAPVGFSSQWLFSGICVFLM